MENTPNPKDKPFLREEGGENAPSVSGVSPSGRLASVDDILNDDLIRQVLAADEDPGPAADPETPEPADRVPSPPVPEDPQPEENSFFQKHKTLILCLIPVLVLLLAAGIFGIVPYNRLTRDDGLILPNVELAGISIGGMTKEQVYSAVKPLSDALQTQSMTVDLEGTEVTLSPALTGASLNVDRLYEDAYSYGRTGSPWDYYQTKKAAQNTLLRLSLYDYLSLNTDAIREELENAASQMSSQFHESTVSLEGTRPALDIENLDEDAPGQVLVITIGTPGFQIDTAEIYEKILTAYGSGTYTVEAQRRQILPKAIDPEELYRQYAVSPIDAKADPVTDEVIPEVYGYDFDLNIAKQLLSQAKPGQTVEIPFRYVTPSVLSITLREARFADVLAQVQTYQSSNFNRCTNLRLACEAINGIVLNPGDVFSFNGSVGERTEEKGYLPALAYVGGESADDIGGGICQVASTLYYACLHADLEIVERWCHMYPSDYVPYGMDATVYWGYLDYQFRNNTDHPLRIDASYESDGYVTITLRGVDDKTTYVEMEYVITAYIDPKEVYQTFTKENAGDHYDGEILQQPLSGLCVTTYRCRYDKQTNQLISREYEDSSRYDAHDKIIVKIEEPTTEPTTKPTTEPTTESTWPAEETTTEPPIEVPSVPETTADA